MRSKTNISLFTAAAAMFGAFPAPAGEQVGTQVQPLTTTPDATLWTTLNNEVPVCWENAGYTREKTITRDAVAGSWEFFANVRFTGWGDCPRSGDAQHVRIRIVPQGSENSGAGGRARVGTAALSVAADDDPGVQLSFSTSGTADEARVEYTAVHEFGHVLGFIHEQDAPGNEGPAMCTRGVDPDANPTPITAYDRDSVMNYCNRDGNRTGYLTDSDIAGALQIYGVRRINAPPQNACASAQTLAPRSPLPGMIPAAPPSPCSPQMGHSSDITRNAAYGSVAGEIP
jgi:hypothetical protein